MKNIFVKIAATASISGLLAAGAYAHHSFSATYNLDEIIEIRGTLLQVNFRNPHSSVMVQAPDEDGVMRRWGVEWGGASTLMRQGISRESFRAGDEVVITGSPAWNREDFRLHMESILRPADGFGWGFDGETFD